MCVPYGAPYNCHVNIANVNNLFELLRWKSLVFQRQIERATMVFKSLRGLAPEYLCSKSVLCDSA